MASILTRLWRAATGGGSQASQVVMLGPATQSGPRWADASDPTAYAINSWVYACVNETMQAAASAQFKTEQRRGDAWEQTDGPLLDLLQYVSARGDEFALIEELVGWLLLYGNAYCYKLRSGPKRPPIGLQVLPAHSMQRLPGASAPDGSNIRWELRDENGQQLRFAERDVVHIRLFGGTDQTFGQSPIRTLERVINTFAASDQFTYAFYRGGGFPTVVLTSDADLNEADVEKIRARYAEWQASNSAKGRPLILGKSTTLEVPGVSPDTVTARELPARLREEICAVLRVPPALVGIYEYANYANVKEQRRLFYSGPVSQYWRRIAGGLTSQLATEFGTDLRVGFETGHIAALQPDFVEVSQAAVNMLRTHTVDEIRQRLYNDPPIGGDWGGALWGPLSQVVLADQQGNQVGALPATFAPVASAPKAPAAQPPVAKAASPRTIQRRLSAEQRVAVYKDFNVRRDTDAAVLRAVVADWYRALADDVLQRLGQQRAHLGSRVKAPALAALLFPAEDATQALRDKLLPALGDVVLGNGQQALAVLGAAIAFDLEDPRIRRLLAQRSQQMKTVVATAQDRCRATLAEGLQAGEALEDLQARVMEWSATGQRSHAVNVARTEVGVCSNAAALEGYRQGGAAGKEWLSIVDDRSRAEHAAMDGVVVGIDEEFIVDGVACYGPGDDRLGAEGVCQCRCALAPVVESQMTDAEQLDEAAGGE